MDTLLAFLNSSFGVMVSAAVMAAVGLYTWQRKDWEFKEQYHRTQVLLDRQLDLVDRINKDVGKLVALAADISSPILKGAVSKDQTDESIRAYNEFESSWFGQCEAYKASLAFNSPAEIVDAFTRVIEATENLDVSLGSVRTKEGAEQAYEAGLAVYKELRKWNAKVLKDVKGSRA
jgi:hypothetical protein